MLQNNGLNSTNPALQTIKIMLVAQQVCFQPSFNAKILASRMMDNEKRLYRLNCHFE